MPPVCETGITPFTFVADDTSQLCLHSTAKTFNFLQPAPNYTRLTFFLKIIMDVANRVSQNEKFLNFFCPA